MPISPWNLFLSSCVKNPRIADGGWADGGVSSYPARYPDCRSSMQGRLTFAEGFFVVPVGIHRGESGAGIAPTL